MHVIGRRDQRQQRLRSEVTGEVDCFRAEYQDVQDTVVMVMVLVVVMVVKQFG